MPREVLPPRPRASSSGEGGGLGVFSGLLLLVLLVLPALALRKFAAHQDAAALAAFLAVIGVFTFVLYGVDKRRARAGRWRIPEATLHLLAAAGGWPAAFVAQRWFRHKTARPAFQFWFWLIVLAHQFVALDYRLDGLISDPVRSRLEQAIHPRP